MKFLERLLLILYLMLGILCVVAAVLFAVADDISKLAATAWPILTLIMLILWQLEVRVFTKR